MTAALTGVSAAAILGSFPGAIPAAPSEPVCITAHAANGQDLGEYHNCKTYIGAYEVKYDYYDNSDGVTIYSIGGGPHDCGPLIIPQQLSAKNVIKIDDRAANALKCSSVTLPDTVREIGARAFEACTCTSITLPSSLQKIGVSAFARAHLQSITIPAGVSVIEDSTFAGCDKLKSVSMEGVTLIDQNAFLNCNQLTSVVIREDCQVKGTSAVFSECRNIQTINNRPILGHATDENGITYPVLDPQAYSIIERLFAQCSNVKFIDDYCEELCKYVVKTETSYDPDSEDNSNDWMCDALKARQLHDWLIRHCEFNKAWRQNAKDMRNFNHSAFFLSYAMSKNGIGKSVCSSYSKAYTMLLHAAGIESAVIGDSMGEGHAWNVVKINNNGVDQYYEVDTLWDDQKGSGYDYFLKSDAEMTAIHEGWVFREMDFHEGEHAWLDDYTGDYEYLKAQCVNSFADTNHDGILDYDFDLDGAALQGSDWDEYNGTMQFCFGLGSMEYINTKMSVVLDHLLRSHMSYYDYMNAAAPSSVSVPNGETAEFKVTLFGENLHYQWFLYVERYNRWDFIENAAGISPTLRWEANEYSNGDQFVCRIMNQNGYYLFTTPVTLTVS